MSPHGHWPTSGPKLLLFSLLGAIVCFAFATTRLQGLLFNSALLSLGTLAISLPVGTLLAFLLSKTSIIGRRTIQSLMIAMLFVPLFVQATAWKAALEPTGWLNSVANLPTGLSGWPGAIWVHGVSAIPWVTFFVSVALSHVPRELEEEALQDGYGPNVLWQVSLPRARGAVIASALWITVICFGEITITDLFQIRTFAEEIYTAANLGVLNDPLHPRKQPLAWGSRYRNW